MADDDQNDAPAGDQDGDRPDLAEAGKRALAEERRSRKAAETSLKQMQAEMETLRQQSMNDQERALAEARAQGRTEAEQAVTPLQAEAARLRVALRKGLNETQAKRLVGTTEEELEADADDLLASFSPPAVEPVEQAKRPVPPLGQGKRDGTPKPSMEVGRERGRADREAAEQKKQQRDPFAGMRVLRGS